MQLFYCYITCYVFNTVLTCVTYGRLRHVTNVSYRLYLEYISSKHV